MSVLAPGFLLLAVLALAAVVIAHLFSRSRPREMVLPTARFVPEGAARAPTRARTPTDLLLLLVRAAIVLLVGAAFAQPLVDGVRRDVVRVFVVDVSGHLSRDIGARAAALDSVRALYRERDAIVAFDTGVRRVQAVDSLFAGAGSGDSGSLSAGAGSGAPGSLSAGLVGAMRAASALARTADSIEIIIVSPLHLGELDSATLAIRAAWPGRIRVIRSPGEVGIAERATVELVAAPGDPLRTTVALAGGTTGASMRIIRSRPSAADSAWAAAGNRVLVVWPASVVTSTNASLSRTTDASSPPTSASSTRTTDAPATSDAPSSRSANAQRPDSIGAVVAGGRVLVAAFERGAMAPDDANVPPSPSASPAASSRGTRVVARWMDGRPAATESVHGSGCIRTVAIPVPVAGDLTVRPEFVLFARELLLPCGGRRDLTPAPDEALVALRGEGPLAAASELARTRDTDSRPAGWLLAAALLLAMLEHLLRRGPRAAGGADAHAEAPASRAGQPVSAGR